MGLPPTSTIGFGRISVSSLILVPSPPANITTFIVLVLKSIPKLNINNFAKIIFLRSFKHIN